MIRSLELPPLKEAFLGAQRAAGYIERSFTVHGPEIEEVRAGVRAADAEQGAEDPPLFKNRPSTPTPVPPIPAPTPLTPHVAADPLAPPQYSPSRAGHPAPKPTQATPSASVPAFQSISTKPATATQGIRGVLAKLGFRVAPSAAEQAAHDASIQRDAEQLIRQATWTRAVSVLVANPKGGTGKTPVSVLLGGVLGTVRGGSVVVVEVADDPGTLTFRSEGDPRRGLGELVRDLSNVRTVGQLAGYTAPQTSFTSIIGSTSRRAPLTHEAVTGLAHVLDEFYAIRIMDSGNHPTSGAFRAAIETADALVIPVVYAEDSNLAALALLDELRAAGGNAATLADRSVIIRLTDGRAESTQVTARVEQRLKSAGPGAILTVPYDPHIAERGPLTLDLLAPKTRAAFTIAAATVVTTLQATVP